MAEQLTQVIHIIMIFCIKSLSHYILLPKTGASVILNIKYQFSQEYINIGKFTHFKGLMIDAPHY